MAARPYRRAASVKVKIAMAKKTPLSQSDTGAAAAGARRRRTSSNGPARADAATLAERSAATLDEVLELPAGEIPIGDPKYSDVPFTSDEPQSVSSVADRGARDFEQEPARDEIARRAYFRFLQRGGEPGRDQEDWFEAERELKHTR